MRIASIALAAALAASPSAVLAAGKTAAPSYTLTTTTYSQNFDGLAASGTSQSLPAGFQIVENGTGNAADGFYAAGTGSSNVGNAFSFGASGSTDRALGSLTSGSIGPIWFGGVFTNGLAGAIESLAFAYTGEQWRSGTSTNDGLTFQFSLDATDLESGTWVTYAGLNFTPTNNTNAGAINGHAFGTAISGTISDLSIGQGQRFGFRWADVDSAGSDHGLAVDDLSISAGLGVAAVPEPSTWAMLILGFGIVGRALRRRRALAFA
ncbi:MAG: PEPxxWA-CTERM sorting domain-containing protein [Altererythrobacter sp.]|nr:PEPxxWA-CTERM sorting domain-containing protein [Altererythrobacter sp.]